MVASPGVLAAERDREEWVKYEDTPREVKRALDRERGNHEIKRIDHVFRDGREFYRAIIDTKFGEIEIELVHAVDDLGRFGRCFHCLHGLVPPCSGCRALGRNQAGEAVAARCL